MLLARAPELPGPSPSARRTDDLSPARAHKPQPDPRGPRARGTRIRDAQLRGRPGAADDPARARRERDRNHMAADGLPSRGVGRDRDHRPARRHVRQGAHAAVDARRARARDPARGRLDLDRAADPRALHTGRERRHLPARVRHRPRRVPARARRREHRAAVGDPRRRSRHRDRPVGRDRRAPELPLAVLATARGDDHRRSRNVALHSRIARAPARQDQLARRRAYDRRDVDRAARDQRDDDVGLGLIEDTRPARDRRRDLGRSGYSSRLEARIR